MSHSMNDTAHSMNDTALSRLDQTWRTLGAMIRVAADHGSEAAIEYVCEYMCDCDAVDARDEPLFEKWMARDDVNYPPQRLPDAYLDMLEREYFS